MEYFLKFFCQVTWNSKEKEILHLIHNIDTNIHDIWLGLKKLWKFLSYKNWICAELMWISYSEKKMFETTESRFQ